MKLCSLSMIVLLIIQVIPGFGQSSCVICHKQLEDELQVIMNDSTNDTHFKNGISCVDCHGGDPNQAYAEDMEAAMNPKKGYIGIPKRNQNPQFCAKCHSDVNYIRRFNPNLPTDQYSRYFTSEHGLALKRGDEKVAVCTDCHGVHQIQTATVVASMTYVMNIPQTCGHCHNDASYMKGYNLPTNQFELYKKSVHGVSLYEKGDRSSPTCNDCHGNHGAFPPAVSSISNVCGICHVSQVELFLQSPHKEGFAEMGLPQCESCHGNHEIKPPQLDWLGVDSNSVCIDCHDEGSKGYEVAQEMRQIEVELVQKIDTAQTMIQKAENAGVEVGEGRLLLRDAHNGLVKVRNAVHIFSIDKFSATVESGLEVVQKVIHEGESALKEVQNRRRWLALISILIFIAAISLYFKLKLLKEK